MARTPAELHSEAATQVTRTLHHETLDVERTVDGSAVRGPDLPHYDSSVSMIGAAFDGPQAENSKDPVDKNHPEVIRGETIHQSGAIYSQG